MELQCYLCISLTDSHYKLWLYFSEIVSSGNQRFKALPLLWSGWFCATTFSPGCCQSGACWFSSNSTRFDSCLVPLKCRGTNLPTRISTKKTKTTRYRFSARKVFGKTSKFPQEKEEKKSLKERLLVIQEVTQGVQNAIGKIASLLESIKKYWLLQPYLWDCDQKLKFSSMFNFAVPYLSWIAISLLLLATCVLYLIPIKYLLMLWATNKFLRRIFRPHVVPNNEVLDLLSRIPDDEMLVSDCMFLLLVLWFFWKISSVLCQ